MFCEGVYISQDCPNSEVTTEPKRLIVLAKFETSSQRHDGNATTDRSKPVSWMIADAIRSTGSLKEQVGPNSNTIKKRLDYLGIGR